LSTTVKHGYPTLNIEKCSSLRQRYRGHMQKR